MKRAGVIPLPELRIVRRQADQAFGSRNLGSKRSVAVASEKAGARGNTLTERRLGRRRVGTGGDDRTRSEIASASRTYGDLDDLLLDRVLHQLRLVMDIELAH